MQLLSAGDLDTEIVRSRQNDEIGAMKETLTVFRDSMIEARALASEQDRDRIAKAERAAQMEAKIAGFESTVRSALDNLAQSANSMQSTAQSMSATADRLPPVSLHDDVISVPYTIRSGNGRHFLLKAAKWRLG